MKSWFKPLWFKMCSALLLPALLLAFGCSRGGGRQATFTLE